MFVATLLLFKNLIFIVTILTFGSADLTTLALTPLVRRTKVRLAIRLLAAAATSTRE